VGLNIASPGHLPRNNQPALKVSAWYAPEPMKAGKAIDIFVKVLQKDNSSVPVVTDNVVWADLGDWR
jgi:hypothetical protein